MIMTIYKEEIKKGRHTLPPLKYSYNALEPIIDEQTLKIHHDKHHKAYVDGLNNAEIALSDIREKDNYEYLSYWSRELAFNGSGHILHSIYWTIMAPYKTGGAPGHETIKMAKWCFGSIENLIKQFCLASKKIQGSGWGILAYNPAFRHLEILQCEKHENVTNWGVIPILVCDVWEHAYYLKYKNMRDNYVESWLNLVNWEEVEKRLLFAINTHIALY